MVQEPGDERVGKKKFCIEKRQIEVTSSNDLHVRYGRMMFLGLLNDSRGLSGGTRYTVYGISEG